MDRDEKGRFINGSQVNLGRIWTDESREKLRLANIGKTLTDEHKKKIGDKSRGRKHSKLSIEKISLSRIGDKNPNWNGGIAKHIQGYILILKPEHPFANNRGYVCEHRLIMEQFLGRYLLPKEVVHHINEIVDDNRLENLELFANNAKHVSYHNKLLREKQSA